MGEKSKYLTIVSSSLFKLFFSNFMHNILTKGFQNIDIFKSLLFYGKLHMSKLCFFILLLVVEIFTPEKSHQTPMNI